MGGFLKGDNMISDNNLLIFMGDINKNMSSQQEEINKLSDSVIELVNHVKIINKKKDREVIKQIKDSIYCIFNAYSFPRNKKKYKELKLRVIEIFNEIE